MFGRVLIKLILNIIDFVNLFWLKLILKLCLNVFIIKL